MPRVWFIAELQRFAIAQRCDAAPSASWLRATLSSPFITEIPSKKCGDIPVAKIDRSFRQHSRTPPSPSADPKAYRTVRANLRAEAWDRPSERQKPRLKPASHWP